MLKELELKSYKGFRDLKVPLRRLTNIVGLNSRGKTSVLQAIKLISDVTRLVFGGGTSAQFGNVRWDINPEDLLQRLSLGQPEALWLNRNTVSPWILALQFDEGFTIQCETAARNALKFDLKYGETSLRNKALGDTEKQFVTGFFSTNPIFVPPLGSVTRPEQFRSHDDFSGHYAAGNFNDVWRNTLFWLYNDGNKAGYQKVVEFVQRYISESALQPPKLSHGGNPSVVIEFAEGGQTYDVGLSGAGMRTLLNLGAVLMLSGSRLILLDEPDAHLHSSLQRAISNMLVDFSCEHDVQIVAATHAPDFITEAPIESLVWIDRVENEARGVSELNRVLIDLGALSKTEALREGGSQNAVLFLEGSLDKRLLSAACSTLPANPFLDGKVKVAKLPDGRASIKSLKAGFEKLLKAAAGRDIRVVAVCDCDFDLEPASDSGIIFLKRKEVENYLIEPEVFAAAAKAAAATEAPPIKVPTDKEVRAELQRILASLKDETKYQLIWRYRETLDARKDPATKEKEANAWFEENWEKIEWQIARVRGKQVLRRLRSWCQAHYRFSISDRYLADAASTSSELLREAQEISRVIYN